MRKDISDDFKVAYKSPIYLNKSKVKKLDHSFLPKTNKDYDHVSTQFLLDFGLIFA
jgi:hypothetical protein